MSESTDVDVSRSQLEVLAPIFDYYAKEYFAWPATRRGQGAPSTGYYWFRKRQKVLQLLERHFRRLVVTDRPCWKFAELGCGEGVDLFLIRQKLLELACGRFDLTNPADQTHFRFFGTDGNSACIRLCSLKRNYYRADDTTVFGWDLTEDLPFKDGELDFVYCSEVLEHLGRTDAASR